MKLVFTQIPHYITVLFTVSIVLNHLVLRYVQTMPCRNQKMVFVLIDVEECTGCEGVAA